MGQGKASKVIFYNKGGFEFEDRISRFFNKLGFKIEFISGFDLLREHLSQREEILIVHISDEDWRELLTKVPAKSICLRVSEAGIGGLSTYREPFKTNKGVFVLHLTINPTALDEEWEKIVPVITDPLECESFIDGTGHKGIKYFFLRQTCQISAVFIILCQGYLASHISEPDKSRGCIREAVDKMGWSSLVQTNKEIVRLSSMKKERMTESLRWRQLFQEFDDKDSLLDQIKNELQVAEVPEILDELADEIFKGDKLNDPELIAEAYLNLVNRPEY